MMPEAEADVGVKRSWTEERSAAEHDDYGSANKVLKSDNVEVRLLLLGRNCGGIIGKGGENITRLRSSYNVNLRMPSTQTIDRAMTINGTVENCIAVAREVLTHSPTVPYSTNQQCSIEMNLLVQTQLVGSILGKGGARITEIRDATNAKVKVYEECLPGSNERVIAIGGDSEEQVLIALTTIMNVLKDIPNRRPSRPLYYDPSNKTGETMRMPSKKATDVSAMTNIQIPWGNTETMDTGGMGGFISNAPLMSGNIQPLMGNAKPIGNFNNGGPSFLSLHTVTNITAPNDMCGAIIGKGGTRISDIRNGSGAQINFSESAKDSKEDRVITITGTQQQVQRAEQMITRYMCNTGT